MCAPNGLADPEKKCKRLSKKINLLEGFEGKSRSKWLQVSKGLRVGLRVDFEFERSSAATRSLEHASRFQGTFRFN